MIGSDVRKEIESVLNARRLIYASSNPSSRTTNAAAATFSPGGNIRTGCEKLLTDTIGWILSGCAPTGVSSLTCGVSHPATKYGRGDLVVGDLTDATWSALARS